MCTGIFIKTKDGKFIFARTLEFGVYLKWKQFCSLNIKGTIGHFQNVKQGFMTDGLNSNGLFVGTFFFPHNDNQYPKKEDPNKINLETGDVNLYLLKNCKNVGEVITLVPRLHILETKLNGELFSLHWLVCDKSGLCIVLEMQNKELNIYRNPYNVITNSPDFPKQVKNVNKYTFLSKYNKPHSLSEGSGALGIPGDSTSMSRFVRAHFFRENMVVPENSKTGMEAALRILHNFDIPYGSVEDKKTGKKEVTEYTVAYSLNDNKVKYAPYGYVIDKNNEWKQSDNPVKKCVGDTKDIFFSLVTVVGLILMYKCR